jgi:hypothetical protein
MTQRFESSEKLLASHRGAMEALEKQFSSARHHLVGDWNWTTRLLRINDSEISGAPICTGGASPLRVATGGNANWSSKVRCRRSPARANRRRDWRLVFERPTERMQNSERAKNAALPLNQTE